MDDRNPLTLVCLLFLLLLLLLLLRLLLLRGESLPCT